MRIKRPEVGPSPAPLYRMASKDVALVRELLHANGFRRTYGDGFALCWSTGVAESRAARLASGLRKALLERGRFGA